MVNHVTEEQRSPAGWILGQMGTKLREAVLGSLHCGQPDLRLPRRFTIVTGVTR
jgi:hypothetical protein